MGLQHHALSYHWSAVSSRIYPDIHWARICYENFLANVSGVSPERHERERNCMIRDAIAQLVAGVSLSETEAVGTMEEIMTGAATPAQIGSFLTALRIKGETVDEVAGLARVMRAAGGSRTAAGTGPCGGHLRHRRRRLRHLQCLDGGGHPGSQLGQPVAKHGNRAAVQPMRQRRCPGSAWRAAGTGTRTGRHLCSRDVGFGFMFAPTYHPAMRHVGPVRREIGIRTVFNILGPLTNPAGVRYQVLGVADARSAATDSGSAAPAGMPARARRAQRGRSR